MAAAGCTTRLLLPPYGGRHVYPPAPTSRWYLPFPPPRRKPELRGGRRYRLRGGEFGAGPLTLPVSPQGGADMSRRCPRCSGPLRWAVAAVTRRHLREGRAPSRARPRPLGCRSPHPKDGPGVGRAASAVSRCGGTGLGWAHPGLWGLSPSGDTAPRG